MAVLHIFLVNAPLIYILFSMDTEDTEIQRYRNAEKQRYRDTEIKDTEIKESIYTLATFIYKL